MAKTWKYLAVARWAPVALLYVGTVACVADVLYDNGPIVTNPAGGTGLIAGQPISQADSFTAPGSTFLFSTTGVGATVLDGTAVAEDFTVPAGGWDLDYLTIYAFQTSQTTPTVQRVRVNLWTAAPFSAGSPPPVPDPLPTPVLATALDLPSGSGIFVCHRQGATTTSTERPVFAYRVPLEGLPNGGRLGPGTYWIEWSGEGATAPSQRVFTPLVSPRAVVTTHNARLLNSIDGSAGGPRIWFEGREGFVAGVSDGRAYSLPFVLEGSVLSTLCSGDLNCDASVDFDDIDGFILALTTPGGIGWPSPACPWLNGDCDSDGAVDFDDIDEFIGRIGAVCG